MLQPSLALQPGIVLNIRLLLLLTIRNVLNLNTFPCAPPRTPPRPARRLLLLLSILVLILNLHLPQHLIIIFVLRFNETDDLFSFSGRVADKGGAAEAGIGGEEAVVALAAAGETDGLAEADEHAVDVAPAVARQPGFEGFARAFRGGCRVPAP